MYYCMLKQNGFCRADGVSTNAFKYIRLKNTARKNRTLRQKSDRDLQIFLYYSAFMRRYFTGCEGVAALVVAVTCMTFNPIYIKSMNGAQA